MKPADHREPVLLLHGVWTRSLALLPLAMRLRAQGFRPILFDYASLTGGPAPSVDRLAAKMLALGSDGPVHLVGHSLGGLIALETLISYHGLPTGRVVCLGSPLAGSCCARGLAHKRLGTVLGRSARLLKSGLHELPRGREVGVVAGSTSIGLGRLFAEFDGLNDGTVAVWETRLPGLADHRVLPVSHSSMVFSRPVAELTGGFLTHGRFPPAR